MLKKVLSIVLILVMMMSFNIFALSNADINYNGVKVVGKDAGVETFLSKTGSTITATVYLVGEMNNISAINYGLGIVDSTKVAFSSVAVSQEFENILPANWKKGDYSTKASSGYVGYTYTKLENGEHISIGNNQKVKFLEFSFTILNNTEVTSANYENYLTYRNKYPIVTKVVYDTLTIAPYANSCNDGLTLLDSTTFGNLPNVFSFNTSSLDSYNLSINDPENGFVELSDTTLAGGQSADLTVIPAVGYYISSVMAGETNITSSFDAYRGGTIKYTPTANTAITVTFAEIENVTEDVTTLTGMTGTDASTLPEVFRGKVGEEDAEDASIAFGQIAPNAGKTIASYGMYLTKADGSDVTTMKPGIGPKFPAERKSSNNLFGIIFEQIKAGSYFAQTYIEYTDGSIVFGIKVPFTVAE